VERHGGGQLAPCGPGGGGGAVRPSARRGAGGAAAGHGGGELRRLFADLRRAEPAGERIGRLAAADGRGAGVAGGSASGAFARDGRGSAGNPQGGRGLRAARSVASGGAARVDSRRFRRGGGIERSAAVGWKSTGRGSRPARQSGLRDLYLRLDRQAQRCRGRPPQRDEPPALDERVAGARLRRPLARGLDVVVRHRGH